MTVLILTVVSLGLMWVWGRTLPGPTEDSEPSTPILRHKLFDHRRAH